MSDAAVEMYSLCLLEKNLINSYQNVFFMVYLMFVVAILAIV